MNAYTSLRKAEPRMWRIWYRMCRRCNLNEANYADVKVCDDWNRDISGEQGFINFVEDMWDDYDDALEIDRIDPRGNYDAHNCRWVTRQENTNNMRWHVYTERGRWMHQAKEWWGFNKTTQLRFHERVKRGWSLRDAATIPPFGKPPRRRSPK